MPQSRVQTTDKDNRIDYKRRLLNKVEAATTPSVPELEPWAQVEILEEYANGTPQAVWLRKQLSCPLGDKCMVWPYAKDSDGYGAVKVDSTLKKVHHYAMELRGRSRPAGPVVLLHKCENRACFNPKHLAWGSISDNAKQREEHSITEQVQVEEAPAEEPTVDLPDGFKSWKPKDQYVYLTRTLKLIPEQADNTVYQLRKEV